jgi:peptide/nickel transport system substrate-binding protein
MMRLLISLLALLIFFAPVPASAGPEGQMTWALPVSLVPAWFDPGEISPVQTSLVVMSALHDALVKPMPGQPLGPSLAESWQVSKDGLVYEFTLRSGVLFHNGERVTADDVKFSFDRYRGPSAKLLKERMAAVDVVDPLHIRFRLKAPWSDFMSAYATPLTKAAWIVPKKYIEKVGDDGFKKAPVGAGPYRFVSYTPGVELVLEAHDRYWRKKPSVNRLVLRVVPDDATRLALLKRGDVDIAYTLRGPLAEAVKRTPGLKLSANLSGVTQWVDFVAQQWDPKSPWHDRRVRLAAAVAIDRNAINQAETLGFSRPAASIIASRLEFAWSPPPYRYDPAQARKLLAEAGYPNGFDAGDFHGEISAASLSEAVVNYLGVAGIRTNLRLMERAAFLQQWRERRLPSLVFGAGGAFGNAALRVENFMVRDGPYAYGSHPDMDDLFSRQAHERDPIKRAALLQQIQRLAHERVMFVPIWEPAGLAGVGPRVEESGLGLIEYYPYSAPYEDVRLRK